MTLAASWNDDTCRPTRAEATDVANAVLDGVDGILLGAETLRGKYPVETIKTVSSICRQGYAHHAGLACFVRILNLLWNGEII